MTVGYGAPATGTLTATGFALDGVEYTVDRLTVVTTTTGEDFVRFATTPDLPATARLRLAVPWALDNPGLNRYLALEPASLVSGGTDVDYEWPWSGSIAGDLQDNTAPVYLTRAPGRTGDVSGFWEATLTPNGQTPPYWWATAAPGLSIPDFPHESAGAGTLAPASVSLRGVDYTVEVLAIVSDTDAYGWTCRCAPTRCCRGGRICGSNSNTSTGRRRCSPSTRRPWRLPGTCGGPCMREKTGTVGARTVPTPTPISTP